MSSRAALRLLLSAGLALSGATLGPGLALADDLPTGRTEPWLDAVVLDLAAGFVPFANDVPLLLGVGVRVRGVHEIWARVGFMPTGDDVDHGFGCFGYRAVLRQGHIVRPLVGGLVAGLPASCGHDSIGRPSCSPDKLFIFAAVGGVRVEPLPWLGIGAQVTLGVDTFPNPFGMVELVQTFLLPLSR